MLEVKNLCVSYGHIEALHDVNLKVEDGTIVSIIGSNGAGKTSTVNAISGTVKMTSGQIFWDGVPLPKAPHKIVQEGIVQVPEGRKVFAGLTIEENLIMGGLQYKGNAKEKFQEMYDLFPILGQRRKQQAGTLSGGEQQMLAVGRALMSRPKILMLDEPSLGLAPLIVQQIFEIIREINRKGVTILLVEQNANMALKTADIAYVLETGEIVLNGSGKELLENPSVRDAYLGKKR